MESQGYKSSTAVRAGEIRTLCLRDRRSAESGNWVDLSQIMKNIVLYFVRSPEQTFYIEDRNRNPFCYILIFVIPLFFYTAQGLSFMFQKQFHNFPWLN
jgi:hypothetical protein